ncbi:MAG: hypothetical protein R3F55_15500 [Alphaproteobacteria bacterium]
MTSACGAIAQRCRATIAAAEATIERFDRQATDIVGLVRRWEAMAPALRALVERVYWLLDGWDHVVALWTVGRDGAEARLVDTVQEMRRILPRLPRSEAPAAQVGRAVPGDGSRRLSAMRDWRTGLPDFELARRVEQVRAAVR